MTDYCDLTMTWEAPLSTLKPGVRLLYLLLKSQSKAARHEKEEPSATNKRLSIGFGVRLKSNGRERTCAVLIER